MKIFLRRFMPLALLLAPLVGPAFAQPAIPGDFQPLYRELDAALSQAEAALRQSPAPAQTTHTTSFQVELLTANSNRGEDLLSPRTLPANRLAMQRVKELGANGITLSIGAPLLVESFPRAAEYRQFYQQVAQQARALGLKLTVEMGTFFPEPEFSRTRPDYSGLTLERFGRDLAAMGGWIAHDMKPDHLTILSEPDTMSRNTGLRITPEAFRDLVNQVLPALRQPGVRVGAGAGSWALMAYFERLARETRLDYLDIHFYPVQRGFLADRLEQIATLARQNGKGLSVGEAWLYKVASRELGTIIAGAPQAFARDAYSCWQPLDVRFIHCLAGLARHQGLEFCSFFWMRNMYGYLDYTPALGAMPPARVYRMLNQQAYQNIFKNQPNATGRAFGEEARK